jgi:hypothetical protein
MADHHENLDPVAAVAVVVSRCAVTQQQDGGRWARRDDLSHELDF